MPKHSGLGPDLVLPGKYLPEKNTEVEIELATKYIKRRYVGSDRQDYLEMLGLEDA